MTRVLLCVVLLLLLAAPVRAQSGPVLPATCAAGDTFSYTGVTPALPMICVSADTWMARLAFQQLAPPIDVTTNNVTTGAHGLAPKLSGVATEYLNGVGAFTAPAGGGSVPDATTTGKGIVELATDGESAASLVPQANDARLSNARTPLAHTHAPADVTGTAVITSDSRLSDARTPTAHASTHLSNGSDPIAGASTTVRGTVELATDGESAASLVPQANDQRLSNARAPTAHASTHQPGGGDALAVDAAAGTGSLRTLGTGATTAAAGNDARLSDARTPTAHATSHKSGGSDAIKLDELAAPTDITTLNASTTAHGLLPKLSNVATQFLNGTGGWTVPAGGGGAGATKLVVTADRQNTTVNFADVTDLTIAVSTATRYVIDCVLASTTAVSTTATQLALNGPTASSLRYTVETATTATATHRAVQTAYDTNTNPATGAAAVPLPIYVRGQLLTTAAGTLAVRFRSEIAASAVNVLAGSYCLVQ